MYLNYKDLEKSIKNKDQKYKNYFDTFGFLVIKNFIDKNDFNKFLKEYDEQYKKRFNQPSIIYMLLNRLGFKGPKKFGFRHIIKSIFTLRRGMGFLPYFLEDSKIFTNFFMQKKTQDIFKYFCGKNWLYLGSDGSKFMTTSFPWHRDWYTKIPIMKCNLYFNNLPFFKGRFKIIPGSNHALDTYSKSIQNSISWPFQNKFPSGMSENNWLPAIENPRAKFSFFNIFKLKRNIFDVPHVNINLQRGDLLLFDHRSLHCVESNFPNFTRRLLTILIGKNAFDFSPNNYLLKHHTKKELMVELLDLITNERNHINCHAWGKELLKTNFIKSPHFIDIKKRKKGNHRYDFAQIKINGKFFSSSLNFNHYSNIGNRYFKIYNSIGSNNINDNSQSFSYDNVHLGINAQNIDKIETD